MCRRCASHAKSWDPPRTSSNKQQEAEYMMHTQIEIERKYLVDIVGQMPDGDTSDIWQTYLISDENVCRRVRKRGKDGNYVYYLTEKRPLAEDRRIETEGEISSVEYESLLTEADPEKQTIHKRRCCFKWENQLFELDTFITPTLPHHLLEIEGAESADAVLMPPFIQVIDDVTGNPDYYNANIAKKR